MPKIIFALVFAFSSTLIVAAPADYFQSPRQIRCLTHLQNLGDANRATIHRSQLPKLLSAVRAIRFAAPSLIADNSQIHPIMNANMDLTAEIKKAIRAEKRGEGELSLKEVRLKLDAYLSVMRNHGQAIAGGTDFKMGLRRGLKYFFADLFNRRLALPSAPDFQSLESNLKLSVEPWVMRKAILKVARQGKLDYAGIFDTAEHFEKFIRFFENSHRDPGKFVERAVAADSQLQILFSDPKAYWQDHLRTGSLNAMMPGFSASLGYWVEELLKSPQTRILKPRSAKADGDFVVAHPLIQISLRFASGKFRFESAALQFLDESEWIKKITPIKKEKQTTPAVKTATVSTKVVPVAVEASSPNPEPALKSESPSPIDEILALQAAANVPHHSREVFAKLLRKSPTQFDFLRSASSIAQSEAPDANADTWAYLLHQMKEAITLKASTPGEVRLEGFRIDLRRHLDAQRDAKAIQPGTETISLEDLLKDPRFEPKTLGDNREYSFAFKRHPERGTQRMKVERVVLDFLKDDFYGRKYMGALLKGIARKKEQGLKPLHDPVPGFSHEIVITRHGNFRILVLQQGDLWTLGGILHLK